MKTDLTLNEHKLLMRLRDEGLILYYDIQSLALDRLVALGFARVLDVFPPEEVKFAWGGELPPQGDPFDRLPRRAVNITDRGRKELQSET